MISLFAIYTIIGTNTRGNPCRMHGWPSLYSFEGKTTQPTKGRVPIMMDSKMDFSRQNWEQKQSVFLQCTQSLVLTQEAILAVGTDVHHCTHLKGKTKRRVPIMHSKMDFSRQNWEQK
jgi:hypothetical protein